MLRVWDAFFREGVKIIFRVGLAIFKLFEREIMARPRPPSPVPPSSSPARRPPPRRVFTATPLATTTMVEHKLAAER